MAVNYHSISTLEKVGVKITAVIYHVKLQQYFYNFGLRINKNYWDFSVEIGKKLK
jgi:hypothetical protein